MWDSSGDRLDRAFWRFHRDNPRVYELLVRYARQAKAAGHSHFGMKMLWERLRWYVMIETRDTSGLKLNNNYHSRYARLIMAREEDLSEMFELRELKTESTL